MKLSPKEEELAYQILIEWEQKCGEPSVAKNEADGDKIVGKIELCAFYIGDEKDAATMKKQQLDIMATWLRSNYPDIWAHACDVTFNKEAHVRLSLESATIAKHFNMKGLDN